MRDWWKRRTTVGDIGGADALRPARDVLTARKDGGAVLLDLRREVYLSLDEAGAIIWEEVERGSPRQRIYDRLAAEYDAPRTVLQGDADAFLLDLAGRGLVVRA